MARRARHAPLKVWIDGDLVGTLDRRPSGAIEFRYERSWLASGISFPISYSLQLSDEKYSGASVLAVFNNLLPDNAKIRTQMAARLKVPGSDAYSLLSAAGRDCVGAMQFLPEGMDPGPVGGTDGTPVTDEEIGLLLDGLSGTPLGVTDDDGDFRISIAGAQDKTALLKLDGRWLKPRGTTATTHILKPPIRRSDDKNDLADSVENEWISLELVRALGLPATRAEIHAFAGRKVLAVERFDRRWTKEESPRLLRLPQEDLCQALGFPPETKYENDGGPGIRSVMDLLRGSDRPAEDRRAFFKAQVVFWLMMAIDGHAKNFSLAMSSGGRFHLTPLYDVLSADPWIAAGKMDGKKLKLAMAVGTSRHYRIEDIVPRHFQQTADEVGLPRADLDAIFSEIVELAPKALDQVAASLPASGAGATFEPIAAGIRKRLKLF